MKNEATPISLFWFRRDLRVHDNHGLYQALTSDSKVIPFFIFDSDILKHFPDPQDSRITFIFDCLSQLKSTFQKSGSDLVVEFGQADKIIKKLIEKYQPQAIYTNEDYEPTSIQRDQKISRLALKMDVDFFQFKDHVIFEKSEILTDGGKPYSVYTPYKNKWLKQIKKTKLQHFPSEKYIQNLCKIKPTKILSLKDIGYTQSSIKVPPPNLSSQLFKSYARTRDLPALDQTSHIGPHLRFGTLSIRQAVQLAIKHSEVWLSELIWREFFTQVLWHHPLVIKKSYRPQFDQLEWRKNKKEFELWCQGKTGIPIVDAGMRELNSTGHMHNRVRMIVANFLTKHLYMHWSLGEKYFSQKLLDYELASNNGNWQWCAGTGCDAAPYFRIFNPKTQQKKFDPDFEYIKKWIPEFETAEYPEPLIDLDFGRKRALVNFKRLK